MAKITIDPVGRIEGHLGIEMVVEDGEVKKANACAPMYRGFEQILEGRHPMDAQRLTQRVCGVCPTAHATASALALDQAFGIADQIPNNGRIIRNLILGSNYLQSHILHFYALAALDYVDVAHAAEAAGDDPQLASVKQFAGRGHLAPFVPRYEGDYRLGDEANVEAVKNGALDGDLADVDIQQITEDVTYSYFKGNGDGVHPSAEVTEPEPHKEGAYSWAKSPRLNGQAHEVGPLARMLVSYAAGNETVKAAVDGLLRAAGAEADALHSTLGRHAARALETRLVADTMAEWVLELKPGEPTCAPYDIAELPDEGEGAGLTGAPRGALGHWVQVEGGKIARYQLVVPTTWNVSPKSGDGEPGPIEQALLGTKVADEQNPFELVRIVRSFDPCLACAVHLITPRGKDLGSYRVC